METHACAVSQLTTVEKEMSDTRGDNVYYQSAFIGEVTLDLTLSTAMHCSGGRIAQW